MVLENGFALGDGEGFHQAQTIGFEIVDTLEVGGIVAAHLEHSFLFAFPVGGGVEVQQRHLHTVVVGGCGELAVVVEVLDFLEYPRVADGGAANHDGIHAVAFLVFQRLGCRVDVAIADDGNGHAGVVLHLPDEGPVGGASVELRASASMDCNSLYANILQLLSGCHDILVQLVPAQPCLDGDGQFDAVDHGAGQSHHFGNILEDGRAGAFVDHLLHGAAPVDVDEVGMGGLSHLGRLAQRLFGVAENLDAKGPFRLVESELAQTHVHIADEGIGGDEFRNHNVGTHFLADAAERRVGHLFHRGKIQREVAL